MGSLLGVFGGHGGSEGLGAVDDCGICLEHAQGHVGGETVGQGVEAPGRSSIVNFNEAVSKLSEEREGAKRKGKECDQVGYLWSSNAAVTELWAKKLPSNSPSLPPSSASYLCSSKGHLY